MKLKKLAIIALAFCMLFAAACKGNDDEPVVVHKGDKNTTPTAAATPEPTKPAESTPTPIPTPEPVVPVMTYQEFLDTDLDVEVCVETNVQAVQKLKDGCVSIYAQDADGAYFIYGAACTAEMYASLVSGQRINVKGVKSEWSGEVEITDAEITLLPSNTYVATAKDVTNYLSSDLIGQFMNSLVAFKGMKVEAVGQNDAGEDVPFFYNWNGSGTKGDDIYFSVSKDGKTFSFTVESDLCDAASPVYAAAEALKIGDTVDLEGFLYWYNGINPHITSIVVAAPAAMSHADYIAAETDTKVIVEAYLQGKQAYNAQDKTASLYLADEDGAYFVYAMPCTEAEYNALTVGSKLQVTGYKSEWAGEVEITEASFTALTGTYTAAAKDVTSMLGDEAALLALQNELVSFKGMTVAAAGQDAEGADVAFFYNWDGSGVEGDDLYFNVTKEDKTFSFVVESSLCDKDSDVYKAVKELKIGDVIDLEGFLYWYNGINPHITKVSAAAASSSEGKSEGVMTYAQYVEAAIDDEVIIEAYVQAKQAYNGDKEQASLYLADEDGAYFVYGMSCSKTDYDLFTVGTKLCISGYKAEWSGEVEIADAVFELMEGSYVAKTTDVTAFWDKEELIDYQNRPVSFRGITVTSSGKDEDGNDVAFLYNYDGSGKEGDDLYFNVALNGKEFSFVVESSLCDKDSDVYKAVKELKVGDVIDVEGFLYWYLKMNPHVTSVKVVKAAAAENKTVVDTGKEAKTTVDLELTSYNDSLISVIKEVRTITGLGLSAAKTLTESAPVIIANNLSAEDAAAYKKQLEDAGATVTLK